jgi:hypothetical protein
MGSYCSLILYLKVYKRRNNRFNICLFGTKREIFLRNNHIIFLESVDCQMVSKKKIEFEVNRHWIPTGAVIIETVNKYIYTYIFQKHWKRCTTLHSPYMPEFLCYKAEFQDSESNLSAIPAEGSRTLNLSN